MDTVLGQIDVYIKKIDQAQNLDDILDILGQQLATLGFDRFTYWLMWQPDGSRASIWLTSYPPDWIKYYIDQKFDSDDMVARYSAVHNSPFFWEDVKKSYSLTKAQRVVFGEAAAVGLRAGGSVPIYGPGAAKAVFSVANDSSDTEFQKLFLHSRHQLHLIATYAHEKIIDLGIQKKSYRNLRLTAREIEVMTWVARGKTRWEISQILSVSDQTVKQHLDNVCQKLGTHNKTQAIAVAIMNGLIIP